MRSIFYLKLCIFAICISGYLSQIKLKVDPNAKCEPYIPYGKSYCSGLLSNPNSIYIPGDSSQYELNAQLEFYWGMLATAGSEKCKSDVGSFVTLCSLFFIECVENSTVSLPMRTCYQTCDNAISSCDASSLYSCASTDQYGPLYPDGEEEFDLTDYGGANNFTLSCFDMSNMDLSKLKLNQSSLGCPPPLIERISKDREADEKRGFTWVTDTSTCMVDCPASIFSTKQWDTFFRLNDTLSIMSTFLTLFLVVTYIGINQEKTAYDKNFSIFIFGVFLMSLSGAIGTFGGRKVYCPEKGRIAVNSDAACAASGFLFQFGSILAILWFAILAFELWWSITRIKRPLGLLKFYIPITLVITIILSCIPFRYYGYQYGIANIMCWVRGDKVQNFVFWGPLGIVITIGTVFIGLVCYEIYKIVRANGKSSIFKLQFKPILMIVLIYVSFVYIFIFEFYISGKDDEYYSHIGDFFDCLTNRKSEDQECLFPGPSSSYYGSYIYFLRIFGIYCFLIFGISRKCLNIWKASIFFNNRYVSTLMSKFSSTTARGSTKVSMKTMTEVSSNVNSIGNTNTESVNYYDDVGGVDLDANYVK